MCAYAQTYNAEQKSLLGRFFNSFNRGFDQTTSKYQSILKRIAGKNIITLGMLVAFFLLTWGAGAILPGGFIPTEDQGMVYVNVTTPQGATVERTEKILDELNNATKDIKEIESVTTLAGYSLTNEIAGASYGMGMINLKSWSERDKSAADVIKEIEQRTSKLTDAKVEVFAPPTVPGFGNTSGFELRLLNKGAGAINETSDITKEFVQAINNTKEVTNTFTSFDASFPQYLIHVDYDMAAKKNVTVDNAMSTLQTLLGSYYATNFIRFNQMYKVMVQAGPQFRAEPQDVLNQYVKNSNGEMVPFSSFIRLERLYGPEQLTRYNMFTSAMINGEPAPGFSSSDAIKAVEKVAAEKLPRGYDFDWSGMTREEILSGNQAVYIFALCLLFVYLLLAAQYESFLLPLPVILSLPAGIFGSFIFLKMAGLDNNIYAQVALVMLIGLLGKNAILIIEFAIQRRKEGKPILDAAVEGASQRLRPILMTSFAFIAGLIPLCIASGAGAIGNRSIGVAAAGGMLIGTVFGLLIIPGLYVLFARLAERKRNQ
ncbi:efflux RND transporter permease subunit [Niabella hibiscisoli]|uniref:efflux RND transporter permease subunit n=1 Tax=Niabella hibiscisoli TaxID=1825928 RepID=UPI001F113561|nr:efflux RND transporter permease subunit [Niabella hibiscisoli]MCH5717742.1 efflux RND transporter permease subunit [Niabella hibiscisoli]